MERTHEKLNILRGFVLAATIGLTACGGDGDGGGGPDDPSGAVPKIEVAQSDFEHLNPNSTELVSTTGSVSGIEGSQSLVVSESFATLQLGDGTPASQITVTDGAAFSLHINPNNAFDGVFNNQASVSLVLGDDLATHKVSLDSLDNLAPVTYLDFPPANGVTDASTITVVADGQDNDPNSLVMSVNGTAVTPEVLEDGRLSTKVELGAGPNTVEVAFKDGNNNTDVAQSTIYRIKELVKNPRDIEWSEQDQLAYVLAESEVEDSNELVIWAVDLKNETRKLISGDAIGDGLTLAACNGIATCRGIIEIALDQAEGRNQIIAIGDSVSGDSQDVNTVGVKIEIATGNRSNFLHASPDVGEFDMLTAIATLSENRMAVFDGGTITGDNSELFIVSLTGSEPGNAIKKIDFGKSGTRTGMRLTYDHIDGQIVMAGDRGDQKQDIYLHFYDLDAANPTVSISTNSVISSTDTLEILDFKMVANEQVLGGAEFYLTVNNKTGGERGVYRLTINGTEPFAVKYHKDSKNTLSGVMAHELIGEDSGKIDLVAIYDQAENAMYHSVRNDAFTNMFTTSIPDPESAAIGSLDGVTNTYGLVHDAARNRLLLARRAVVFPNIQTGIDAVDIGTGTLTPFVDPTDLKINATQFFVFDVALDTANNRLLVLVDDGASGADRTNSPKAGILAFDLDTGERTTIVMTDDNSDMPFIRPSALALGDGVIYVAGEVMVGEFGENGNTRVIAHILETGVNVLIGQESESQFAAPVDLTSMKINDTDFLVGLDADGHLFRLQTLDSDNKAITDLGASVNGHGRSLVFDGTDLWMSFGDGGDSGVVKVVPNVGFLDYSIEIASGTLGTTTGSGPDMRRPGRSGLAVDPASHRAYIFDFNVPHNQIVSALMAKQKLDDGTTRYIGDRVKIVGQ